ncbi:MAG: HisA/HisF-related TIM barrel protein [Bullifex sp.]
MTVIPAIDIISGECVRLSKGDYEAKKSYFRDPLEVAKRFEDAGLTRLHLVDLDGARSGEIKNLKTLERIAGQTALTVDFGGGIKTAASLNAALDAGACWVTCGSIAVKDPLTVLDWLDQHPGRLILGADCRNGFISTSGWMEDSSLEVTSFIGSWNEKGFDTCISTDISKDGMLMGPSFGLYESILKKVPGMNVIASGGITTYEDLKKLSDAGLFGAIVGKAYYEGHISLSEMKEAECLQRG